MFISGSTVCTPTEKPYMALYLDVSGQIKTLYGHIKPDITSYRGDQNIHIKIPMAR